MLWPGTTIPDHKTIVGPNLEHFDEIKMKAVKVRHLNASLALDGWSIVTDDPIAGISFKASGEMFLVNILT